MDANSLLIVLFREVRVKHRALGEALNVHSANATAWCSGRDNGESQHQRGVDQPHRGEERRRRDNSRFEEARAE